MNHTIGTRLTGNLLCTTCGLGAGECRASLECPGRQVTDLERSIAYGNMYRLASLEREIKRIHEIPPYLR